MQREQVLVPALAREAGVPVVVREQLWSLGQPILDRLSGSPGCHLHHRMQVSPSTLPTLAELFY